MIFSIYFRSFVLSLLVQMKFSALLTVDQRSNQRVKTLITWVVTGDRRHEFNLIK